MTRRYRQDARAQGAAETRRRIVEAARSRVIEEGYASMRIEDVAASADVARASVFRHFASKSDILRAVEADAAEKAGVMALVDDLASLEPREALLAAIRDGTRIWAAEATVFQQFYSAAQLDDALKPLVAEKEAGRLAFTADLVGRLAEADILRPPSMDLRRLTDLLWLLLGFGTYDALTRGRGLSPQAAGALIEEVVLRALFP